MTSIMHKLPYDRRMIMLGVYDIVDMLGGEAEHTADFCVSSRLEVFGETNGYSFRVAEIAEGCMLHIGFSGMPSGKLSEDGERRSLNYLADCLDQLIENAFTQSAEPLK